MASVIDFDVEGIMIEVMNGVKRELKRTAARKPASSELCAEVGL